MREPTIVKRQVSQFGIQGTACLNVTLQAMVSQIDINQLNDGYPQALRQFAAEIMRDYFSLFDKINPNLGGSPFHDVVP